MKQSAKEGGKGDTLKVIVQALLIALVVRTFLVSAVQYSFRLDDPDAC